LASAPERDVSEPDMSAEKLASAFTRHSMRARVSEVLTRISVGPHRNLRKARSAAGTEPAVAERTVDDADAHTSAAG
jgi:hypothetical protein